VEEVRERYKKRSNFSEVWRRLKKSKLAMLGLAILLIYVFFSVFAGLISNYDNAIFQNTAIRLQGPSLTHIFGTDEYGRDVFTRVIYGARVSLMVALTTTFISAVTACFIGSVAAYYGGFLDNVIMRILDMFMGIPMLLLAIAISASLGPGIENLVLAMTISLIPGFTRVVRSVILNINGQEFIEAARAYGSSDSHIIIKYVLPNAMGPVIVQATMSIAGVILSTAALSYLGMGMQPPAPELGSMLADGQGFMLYNANLVIFPGLAIAFSALSLNLVGDGLRDALDPRLKT